MKSHRLAPSLRATCLAIACACLAAPAAAQVYRCESESGVPVYQGTPNGRNCRALDLAPLTTIPTPKLPAVRPAAGQSGAAAAARATPGDFPKVDASTQRARDSDRRRILEDELKREESRLAELKAVYKDGEPERLGDERNYQKYLDRVQRLKDDIGRSEGNIASIRRELATVKE
ncbi:MAG: DUF4124 domain-containing protein [Burkholderiales bacterium]|nr:MAG: DUF4124 domain-containing protein [Burkholderiales bacterium]